MARIPSDFTEFRGWFAPGGHATIAGVSVGFPEPADADECRKASPVAVWHSS
jgi:hypothetical protein